MSLSHGASIVRDGLALYIDAASPKSYPGSGTTWFNLMNNGHNFTLVNPAYYSYDSDNNGSFDFNRTLPPDAEDAAYATTNGTGALTALTYLGKNHTTEVWYRINNREATLHHPNESSSALFVFRGFHAMFHYYSNSTRYAIWGSNGAGGWTNNAASFTDTDVGTWNQLIGIREGNLIKIYLNGVLKNTAAITSDTSLTPTTNLISISSATENSSTFSWHADVNVAVAKMYTRALSENEISQNFNAHRGRFGI